MKKLIALLLALSLVFSLAIAVSADEPATPTLKKVYTITGGNTFPAETVEFEVAAASTNPDGSLLTVADLTVTAAENELEITLPEYTKVGQYIYTITEKAGNTTGVTYSEESVTVGVLVAYGENQQLTTQLYLAPPADGSEKNDIFTNTYELGELKVTKEVTGNLGSHDAQFDVTVTFTSANPVLSAVTCVDLNETTTLTFTESNGTYSAVANITVKHGETVTFSNIPAGVAYKVEEAAKHGVGNDGFNPNSAIDTDYTVTYTNQEGTITANGMNATITNNKEIVVETGIALDSIPYVVMLTVAILGMAALVGKKRYEV